MKLAYYIIIFLIANTLCFGQKSYHTSKTKDKRGILVHKLTKKPITGFVYDTYEEGQQRTQATYSEGILNGNYKSWYDNGKVSFEYNYLNSELNGKYSCWDKNGQLIQEFNYFQGEKDGLNREWYSNGQLKTEENYEDFLKDGTFKKWNSLGQLIKEDFYSNGLLNGDCKEWYDNGLLKWSANFDADTISGKVHGWYEDGQIKYQLDNWHLKMWHNNGQISYERIPPLITEDKMIEKYWDESGKEIEASSDDLIVEEASLPEGIAGMYEWVAQNYNYPEIAREMNLQGTIYLTFGVRYDGIIFNIQILKRMEPPCPECESEAISMLKKMPIWNPRRINGIEDFANFALPIRLSLW